MSRITVLIIYINKLISYPNFIYTLLRYDYMRLTFQPIYVTYKIVNDKPTIHMYGRNNNKQICVIDDSFRPYFLAVLNDENDLSEFQKRIKNIKIQEEGKIDASIIDSEIVDKKLIGKKTKAVKIFVNMPAAVNVIKKAIREWPVIKALYEWDIPFTRRYLFDNKITPMTNIDIEVEQIQNKIKVPVFRLKKIEQSETKQEIKLKVLAFDIETYNPRGKSIQPENFPIVMLSLYGKDYDDKSFKKVITWKKFETEYDYVEFVEDEKAMLLKFKQYIEEFGPDMLTGYYSDGFDMPYIISRARINKIKLELGLDYSTPVTQRGRYGAVDIKGIAHIDILNFIRTIIGRSLKTDSYKLDNVAAELLGSKKDEVDISKLAEAWDNTSPMLNDFAKYNLQDSRLTHQLFFKILANMEEMVRIIGLPMFNVTRMSFSQLDEWYIIRKCNEYKEIILNKPGYNQTNERMGQKFQGAFVVEPTPGLYKDIAVFDFRSLYPSIIVSHNISIASMLCDCEDCKKDLVPIEGQNIWFCKHKKGFLSSILEELISRRARIKEILKKDKDNLLLKARSEALKVLGNSFYGYLGFSSARWYCFECGQSVTAYARYYVKKAINAAEKKGFKVLYGDTDSVFLSLEGKDEQDAIAFMDEVNSKLPQLMELEYEEFFPAGLFVLAKGSNLGAKKKYALMRRDKSLKITGFETVRRNVSFIAKNVQEKILKLILQENDINKAKTYVQNIIKEIKSKTIDTEDLVIITQLSKPIKDYDSIGPHVAVARIMEAKGEEVGAGTRVRYIITPGKGVLRDRARLPEDANDYDTDYYINKQVIPVVEKIFEVFGIDKSELEEKAQSKLDAFF